MVIATGSWLWGPRADGADLPSVFTYRTMADLDGMTAWVQQRVEPLGRPLRGIDVHTSAGASELLAAPDGPVAEMSRTTGAQLDADIVVFSTGIRPRDRIARESGLAIEERGGIIIGPTCRTSDHAVWAVGECTSFEGEIVGLVAPGNLMAEVVVDQLLGGVATYSQPDAGAALKGVGVDATSFGGVFVGDTALYQQLRPLLGRPLGADRSAFLASEGGVPVPSANLPDDVIVCSCANVTAGTVRGAVTEHGCMDVNAVKTCTKAGTICGSCIRLLTKLVNKPLEDSSIEVSHAMCEHFAMPRVELFKMVREEGLRTFSDVVAAYGAGRGCAICKPAVASILASQGVGHVLSREHIALQDTNDHAPANMQKDGTYSVIRRVPGGEITPEEPIVIGQVAEEFGLYTRLTGAQRIGMFRARIDQLPLIWQRLADAGMESGQAYGKSLRSVKSCVGPAGCHFGVQDAVGMGVRLEMRYRGLRAPHKFKFGVSGCARECAVAPGKDVGIIATERDWNLYVGGSGGFTPRHAELLAEELDQTIAEHVDNYTDEWRDTLEDPEKLKRCVPFIDELDKHDLNLAYTPVRGQVRPALPGEMADNNPVIARTLKVRS